VRLPCLFAVIHSETERGKEMTLSVATVFARSLRVLLATVVGLSLALPVAADPPVETPGVPPGKFFRQGVVAVSHPLAAEAGASMLEAGGNAFDAAAAIQFALNVVEPQFSGIGGGGFMMIHLGKTGETFMLDARERAPAAATPTMFLLTGVAPGDLFTIDSMSGISVGVPGTLLAVDTALKTWGTMSLAQVMAPAIDLAQNGFHINRFLARDIANDAGRTQQQPETMAVFRPGGVPLVEGDLLVQPDLAKTFKLIAAKGVDAFYRGEISPAIIDAQKRIRTHSPLPPNPTEAQGRMTLADLDQYVVKIRQPITVNYRGWQLASSSPPSSGGLTVGQMLEILERYPIGDASQGFGFGARNTLHVMIESMRLAFADRAVWMGDEDFVPVPKSGLLNQTYVDSRAAMISLASRMSTPAAGNPWPYNTVANDQVYKVAMTEASPEGIHTTHFVVVDKRGNVVSYTTTIEQGWGTGIMVPGYGFLLNNELTDFNLAPTFVPGVNPGANDVAAFKRPRSSMSPSILLKNGEPVAAFGSPGGATIINSVLNVALDLIDHGMTVQQAIDAPRLSVTSAGGSVSCEGGQPFMQPPFSVAVQDALRALGHIGLGPVGTDACNQTIGSVQAVIIDLQTGKQYGGADPRREGTVIGLPLSHGR